MVFIFIITFGKEKINLLLTRAVWVYAVRGYVIGIIRITMRG